MAKSGNHKPQRTAYLVSAMTTGGSRLDTHRDSHFGGEVG